MDFGGDDPRRDCRLCGPCRDPQDNIWFEYLTKTFKLLSDIFLNLIKLLVAPLILSTIVVGIAHMGDSSALGRIGFRAITWFIIASFISIGLGLLMVNIFQPGVGAPVDTVANCRSRISARSKSSISGNSSCRSSPKTRFEAMATNNILQILVFALFAGVALSALGEKGAPLVRGADALAEMMLQITHYVMRYAPIAVFGALAAVVSKSGLGDPRHLSGVGCRILSFAGDIVDHPAVDWRDFPRQTDMDADPLYPRTDADRLFDRIESEAALPKLFEQLDRFGVPRRISGFMLPLGYSFNLDGSMMYMSFATIFIAQAYGIDLSIATQILILLTLMISSKGVAAVPRASLVVITGTLAMFDLPVEGVALILAIDQFLDMGRTATNVVGNAVATSVITKWEGMLEVEEPEFVEFPHAPAHTPSHGRAGLDLAPDMIEEPVKP